MAPSAIEVLTECRPARLTPGCIRWEGGMSKGDWEGRERGGVCVSLHRRETKGRGDAS